MTFATYQDFLEFARGLGVVISYPDKRSRSHLRRQIEDLQGTAPVPEPIIDLRINNGYGVNHSKSIRV
jgi:hypothetical protein